MSNLFVATIVVALFTLACGLPIAHSSTASNLSTAQVDNQEANAIHKSIGDKVLNGAIIAQAIATVIALLFGGLFAWRNRLIFRYGQPHLTITHEITHRRTSPGFVHMAISVILHNKSRVKVDCRDGLFTVEQIAPTSDEFVRDVYDQAFPDHDYYQSPKWHLLIDIPITWGRDTLVAEPGESLEVAFDYLVPDYVQSVLVTTYFYNFQVMGTIATDTHPRDAERRKRMGRRRISGPRGWTRTTAHDMMTPEGIQSPETNTRSEPDVEDQ